MKQVTRKDLLYVIIILVLTIICILGKIFGSSAVLAGMLNFAATVTAIILAVIAIIITINEGGQSRESNKVLKDSVDNMNKINDSIKDSNAKLNTSLNALSDISKSLNNQEIIEGLKDLKTRFEESDSKAQEMWRSFNNTTQVKHQTQSLKDYYNIKENLKEFIEIFNFSMFKHGELYRLLYLVSNAEKNGFNDDTMVYDFILKQFSDTENRLKSICIGSITTAYNTFMRMGLFNNYDLLLETLSDYKFEHEDLDLMVSKK